MFEVNCCWNDTHWVFMRIPHRAKVGRKFVGFHDERRPMIWLHAVLGLMDKLLDQNNQPVTHWSIAWWCVSVFPLPTNTDWSVPDLIHGFDLVRCFSINERTTARQYEFLEQSLRLIPLFLLKADILHDGSSVPRRGMDHSKGYFFSVASLVRCSPFERLFTVAALTSVCHNHISATNVLYQKTQWQNLSHTISAWFLLIYTWSYIIHPPQPC